jgi:hypothetical protein
VKEDLMDIYEDAELIRELEGHVEFVMRGTRHSAREWICRIVFMEYMRRKG